MESTQTNYKVDLALEILSALKTLRKLCIEEGDTYSATATYNAEVALEPVLFLID